MKQSKVHIAHILGTPNFGGAQKTVLELISTEVLASYNHTVIFVLGKDGNYRNRFLEANIDVTDCLLYWPSTTCVPSYRINKWLRHNLVFTFPYRLAKLLNSIDASLVHTHLIAGIYHQAKAALQLANVPFIWTIQGEYRTQRGEQLQEWNKALQLINDNDSALLTGVSRAVLEDTNAEVLLQARKLHVIHNSIRQDLIHSRETRDSLWRKERDIPIDSIVFGSMGRLVEVKCYDLMIEAARQLLDTGANAYFVIVGEGNLREQLQEQINGLGIAERVRLIGFQENVSYILRQMDVFVMTSRSEGLPLALLEACALELPYIATAVGGIPEVFIEGGILVPFGDLQALVDAMRIMLVQKVRETYGALAAEIAREHTYEAAAKQYLALYGSLLDVSH